MVKNRLVSLGMDPKMEILLFDKHEDMCEEETDWIRMLENGVPDEDGYTAFDVGIVQGPVHIGGACKRDATFWDDVVTQSTIVEDANIGEDQVNLTNVEEDEWHPDDMPEFQHVLSEVEEVSDDEEEREKTNYKEFVSKTATNENFTAINHANMPQYEMTEEELADWEENFGEHAAEPKDLRMIYEDLPEVEPGVLARSMAFEDIDHFRDHLRHFAIVNHMDYKVKKTDTSRLYAECKHKKTYNCKWRVSARKLPDEETVTVRDCYLIHTCETGGQDKNPKCNAKFVAEFLLKDMDVTSTVLPAKKIAKDVIWPQLKVDIPYWVANDARNIVLAKLHGSFEESYTKVPQLCTAATTLNPNSIAHFTYVNDGQHDRFESVTLSYDAQIQGFLNGCRMVIGLDGMHLTGKLGGTMLAATALDAQNGLFPLGMMVCRSETEANWNIFLKELKTKIPDREGLTFISDRDKGLLESVRKLFPLANHRYCFRHLYQNFMNNGFKGTKLTKILWQAANTYKLPHWKVHMDAMKKIDEKAWQYLMGLEPTNWARSWFPHDVACEHINSNFSESFNAMCKKLRDKPVIKLSTMYTQLVTGLYYRRRQLAANWQSGDLVPAAKKLIQVMTDLRGNFDFETAEELKTYLVTNKVTKKVFTVHILDKTCSCRQWQLRKFPCIHSVRVLHRFNPRWAMYCSKYYTVDMYWTTYSWSITPLGDIDDWENKSGVSFIHPLKLREKGRPCVKRRKSWMEKNAQKKVRKCSTCGGEAHNKSTCQGGPVGSNSKTKLVRSECLVDGDTFLQKIVTPKKQRKSKLAPAVGYEKKTTTAAPTTTSTADAGSKKKTTSTAPSTSTSFAGTKRIRKPNLKFA